MKQLHRLVLKSFVGPFILTFFIVVFILLMQFLWRYIDDLIGKGLSFWVIGELLLYTSSSLVPMALPLSILMSSLMTFGNMGEFYELTAIKASGISLQRIMMPLIIFIFFISIGAFFFANEVLPYTNLKMRSLLYDVRNQRPEIQVLPGSFYNGVDGYSMRVDRKDPETNMLYNVKIYDHTERRGNVSVIIADSGRMIVTEDQRNLIFTLYSGYSYNEMSEEDKRRRSDKTYPHRYDRFEEQQLFIELVGFSLNRTDENLFRNHYSMLDLKQLSFMEDSIQVDIETKSQSVQDKLVKNNYFKVGHLENAKEKTPKAGVIGSYKSRMLERFPHLQNKEQEKENQTVVKSNAKFVPLDSIQYFGLFESLTIQEKMSVLRSASSYARSARTHMISSADNIDTKIRGLRRFQVEWHRKFTIAFACFVFLLIGAPLGAIIRKGGLGLPLVLSTLFFIFYYILSLMGEKFVRESIMPDYQGMWMTSLIYFTIGIFLTYKATTDAALLNLDTYVKHFRKLFGIRHKSILNQIALKKADIEMHELKYDNLVHSLKTFRDKIDETLEETNQHLSFGGFLLSLVGVLESSNIVLFERLYENVIFRISKSSYIHNRTIKNKLLELPSFNYKHYIDLKGQLFIKFILLLIPPVTVLVILRQLIQLNSLKTRLKTIDKHIEDLTILLRKTTDSDI